MNSTLDVETVLSTIVAKAVQLSGTEAGAIYVFDELRREFHLRATYGMEQELIDALTHRRIGMGDPNVAAVMAGGETNASRRFQGTKSAQRSTKSSCTPVIGRGWWRRWYPR